MKTYLKLWLIVCGLMTFEYSMLNHAPEFSILQHLQNLGFIQDWKLITLPGKRLSLYLGWTGFGIMFLTNFYSMRKRFFPGSRALGTLSGWLNFHIFCGLVGPTLILFHTDFKIGGLVAISFWSMVISFASGVIGRYFYLQITGSKKELEKDSESYWEKFRVKYSTSKQFPKEEQLVHELGIIQSRVLSVAGADTAGNQGILYAILSSMTGDLRLRFALPGITETLPSESAPLLKSFAILKRRTKYLGQFQQVMGYWHSFHMPFAFLMYIFALVHIATALLMRVPD